MDRDTRIVGLYKAFHPASEIAQQFSITERQVQRIVKRAGAMRTITESFNLAIEQGRMKYYRKPAHLKRHRKRLSDKLRYEVLQAHSFTCDLCGATAKDGQRIEIDYKDDDPTNNALPNLQVLCAACNKGKARASSIVS